MIRVVLARTQGPRNAGLAARAVENFGPAELWFVAPEAADLFTSCEFYAMAHGVKERRTRFPVVATIEEALAECTDSFGFTARMRRHRPMLEFDAAADSIKELAKDPARRVALVFGGEVDGLSTAEAASLQRLVHVRTAPAQPSINLGAAVSIVMARLYPGAGARRPSRRFRPLEGAARERLLEHLEHALLPRVVGEAARKDLARSLSRVFARATLETTDARAWHRLARALLGELGATRRRGSQRTGRSGE